VLELIDYFYINHTLKQKITFTLPAVLSISSFVRHVAQEVFVLVKFNKMWVHRLKLVVDELFMNAVKYGSTEGKSELRITFEYDDKEITFSIEDDGTGEKAVPAEELKGIIEKNKSNTDLARTSGRGLAMITDKWTDSSDIKKSDLGGILASFTKTIQSEDEVKEVVTPVIEKTEKTTPVIPTQAEEKRKTYDVKVSGEIDQSNIQEKTQPITDLVHKMEANSVLNLDLSDTEYINSTFIGSLASWHTTLQQKGGEIYLKNMCKPVRDILEMIGLLNVIPTIS